MSRTELVSAVRFCPTCDKPFAASMNSQHSASYTVVLKSQIQLLPTADIFHTVAVRSFALKLDEDRARPARLPKQDVVSSLAVQDVPQKV